MKKLDPVEQLLNRLTELRHEPGPATTEEIRKALKHRSNLVVAKAAKVAGELCLVELEPDLTACFERLMGDPAKLDKRCAATTEIVAALFHMDWLDPAVYLRGIRHVQLEGSWGPHVDEAAKLRALCALGLVRTNHPDSMTRVVDLLADPEPQARIGAVQALGACSGERATLLLRFKSLCGDTEPEVLGECFARLLENDFERSLPLLARYVEADDPVIAERAILAVATQRRPEAFRILREKWERTVENPLRKVLLTAMATARLEEAADFLIGLVKESPVPVAVDVIKELARYRRESRVRDALAIVVQQRGEAKLITTVGQEF